jgi:AcrR family transcriptional regulator
VLRDGDGQDLREYLIATAARLIGQRGSAGLAVRDIAREAQVADGVLYNYFEDKDDLLAHALLAHVASVMRTMPLMPDAGTGTVTDNLQSFIDAGMKSLTQVAPAFVGLMSQPGVLRRFHAMVGGDAAFGAAAPGRAGDAGPDAEGAGPEGEGAGDAGPDGGPNGRRGLPDILRGYLGAEQRIGRVDPAADVEAAVTLIVGTIHGEVLPRIVFAPPGHPPTIDSGLAGRVATTIMAGIGPRAPRR